MVSLKIVRALMDMHLLADRFSLMQMAKTSYKSPRKIFLKSVPKKHGHNAQWYKNRARRRRKEERR